MPIRITSSTLGSVHKYMDVSTHYVFSVELEERKNQPEIVSVTLHEKRNPIVEPREGFYEEDLYDLVKEAEYHKKHS
jgi:hypothetical protein